MKKSVWLFLFVIVISCKTENAVNKPATAFKAYQISHDEKGIKVLRGLITRTDIEKDTSFNWFKKNYNLGKPDATAVAAFKQHINDFQMVVFGGTWCPDTQNLLPQFYKVVDASQYSENNITLVGVDHSKTTLDNLDKSFHIINVPTFIVMKNGKEAGRVIEYGESGEAMKELGKIVAGL